MNQPRTVVNQPRVLVAQLGARRHYAVPRIFHQANQLEKLYTDICITKGWPRFFKDLPTFLLPTQAKKLIGRNPYGISAKLITAFTNFGFEYAYRLSKAATATEITAVTLWAGDHFNDLILKRGFGNASLLYGYNSASEKLLQPAKQNGMATVVEQTIAPKSTQLRILQEEVERLASWRSTSQDKNIDLFSLRERKEWDLADLVICGSEFVRQNIIREGGDGQKCVVVPSGVDSTHFHPKETGLRQRRKDKPLQVLFVGSVGLRKGIYYLVEAMRRLDKLPIQCRVVGPWSADTEFLLANKPSNVEFCGSIPRSEILSEFHRADVFCLPSLCEGSAIVIYEALASGLPVITTPNSGSIIRDGIEGYILPIRDICAIAERLEAFIAQPALLEEMSHAALLRSEYGSLQSYSKRLVNVLTEHSQKLDL